MIKILVDKPSAGSDRGHICTNCIASVRRSGPGWEEYRCSRFQTIDRQVTDCSYYKSRETSLSYSDAPGAMLNTSMYFMEYDGRFFFLRKSQFDVFRDVYSDSDKCELLKKWGIFKDE